MSDLIERQTAIDAVQGIGRLATLPDNDDVVRMSAVEYVLFNLPSAEPEIIRCKDCKYYAGEGMYCALDIMVHYDHFFCYHAERRTDG